MVAKIIDATEARVGTNLILDGECYTVKKIDISKTGKHGHAKCRVEASHMLTGNKKVLVVPGHDRFEVPLVNKSRGQILSITGNNASIMDLESFETIEIPISEEAADAKENDNVEYWDIEGTKVIKRKL